MKRFFVYTINSAPTDPSSATPNNACTATIPTVSTCKLYPLKHHKKMLHLTARFHLQLQMSTNEHQRVEIFGLKVASKGMNHSTTDKQTSYFSILKKNSDMSAHTVHIKSALKIFSWKLYQSFSKWRQCVSIVHSHPFIQSEHFANEHLEFLHILR